MRFELYSILEIHMARLLYNSIRMTVSGAGYHKSNTALHAVCAFQIAYSLLSFSLKGS